MSKLLNQILKVFLTLLIPLVIVLGVVRLVATEPYLAFEYGKSDFPDDPFGFDRTQRLAYAAANLQFITQNQSLEDLAGQEQNGNKLYNSRELKHMEDVQNVYQAVWGVWQVALFMAVLCGLALNWRKESRLAFASVLKAGGAFTSGLVLVVGLVAIVVWQTWFSVFHQIFFATGSWMFSFSDTLIRLFPEKFWYDASLTIASLSVLVGSLVYWVGSRFSTINKGETDLGENENPQSLEPATPHQGF